MNKAILENINKVVKSEDRLWILGDVALGNREENLTLLKDLETRNITIISGNHDLFHPLYGNKSEKHLKNCKKIPNITNIETSSTIQVNGTAVQLSHFPYEGESAEGRSDRYVNWRLDTSETWLLCGHVHTMWRQKDNMINVGVDAWGGFPVSSNKIAELLKSGKQNLPILPWLP